MCQALYKVLSIIEEKGVFKNTSVDVIWGNFFLNRMKIDFISKIIQLAKYYFLIFTFNK